MKDPIHHARGNVPQETPSPRGLAAEAERSRVSAAALADQVRHVAALVADAVGQATIEDLPIPPQIHSVQAALLTWARRLEQQPQRGESS